MLRKGADNEVQSHNTSSNKGEKSSFFSSVQCNQRRDTCHQAALLIMQSSPSKCYNQVCPAAPWKADGTVMTQGIWTCSASPRFTGVKAHLSCALTADEAHEKHQAWKVGRSQMGPFLSMKVARNIFAWNDFKPKEVHGKRPGFIRKFVRKWCTTLTIYPNYILHIRKKLTKRGKVREQGRKLNFSKFLTLANFSHSHFAIFPFKWLYELYKLYKHFNHLPLKRDGHKRSLWF